MTTPDLPEDIQTIGSEELALLLGRSVAMVRVDAARRPGVLPPRFVVPGTRRLRWRVVDVKKWMDALAEIEGERRAKIIAFQQANGVPKNQTKSPKVRTLSGKAAEEVAARVNAGKDTGA